MPFPTHAPQQLSRLFNHLPRSKSKRAIKTPEKEFESHRQPRQNPKAAYECIAA
jgi:hypothetical protein